MQNGVEKVTEALCSNTLESQASQWRGLRNKIDSILLSTTTLKTDEVRAACREIDGMPADQRRAYIATKWGTACCHKVDPMLIQLQLLESHMN